MTTGLKGQPTKKEPKTRGGEPPAITAGTTSTGAGEMLDAFSVQLVGHANLDGIQLIQNIQLGDGEAVKTVHLNGITPDDPIEPTASPPPATNSISPMPVKVQGKGLAPAQVQLLWRPFCAICSLSRTLECVFCLKGIHSCCRPLFELSAMWSDD